MNYPRTIHRWQKIPCSCCGVEYTAARTQPRIAQGPEDEMCSDCQDYERAYRDGYEAGRKDVLDKLLPKLRQITATMETDDGR